MKKIVQCECIQFYDDKHIVRGIKPVYKTKGAACADVAIPFTTVIKAGTAEKIDLWIGFQIPKGYKIIMYPRSSLLIKKGLIQPVSIIDADYSGMRVHVPLFNPTDKDIVLEAGERVAQIECVPCYECNCWDKEEVTRDGGFGSTN